MNTKPSRMPTVPSAALLGALGVVFGDIGTSPLYTMKAVLGSATPGTASVVGAVSAIVWGLILVVTLKYVWLVLRADHHGEGGILALTALASRVLSGKSSGRTAVLMVGILGAALFYGDSVITPAISVLGAVEGLELVAPSLSFWVVPLSLLIVLALFSIQRFGTSLVGRLFGPVMLLWFGSLAFTGISHILQTPAILAALDPRQALHFLSGESGPVLLLLGGVVLAFTGAEALYADLGHFGRRAIRRVWLGLVLPALALNYLGQGALLLDTPTALENPFFLLFSAQLQIPAVLLATLASVIASQAVISGTFSLTQQAIQLGLLPRLRIRHTSEHAPGQIVLPAINGLLCVAVLLAILGFGSSAAMASAYGIAVTVTMLATTVLIMVVARLRWQWSWLQVGLLVLPFVLLDTLLVIACAMKFQDGGWFSLLVGLILFVVMTTWRRGRMLMHNAGPQTPALAPTIERLEADTQLHRCVRTAVFPTADLATAPRALLHNLEHNEVLHRRNILIRVHNEKLPRVDDDKRVQITELSSSFWKVRVSYGFMELPDLPAALTTCRNAGLDVDLTQVSYFLSREIVVPTPGIGMALWREHFFAWLSRNAESNVGYFQLPDDQVIVLAARVPI